MSTQEKLWPVVGMRVRSNGKGPGTVTRVDVIEREYDVDFDNGLQSRGLHFDLAWASGNIAPIDIPAPPPVAAAPAVKWKVGDRVVVRGTVKSFGAHEPTRDIALVTVGTNDFWMNQSDLHPEAWQPQQTTPAPTDTRGLDMHLGDMRALNDRLSSRLADVGSDNSRLQRELDRANATIREQALVIRKRERK